MTNQIIIEICLETRANSQYACQPWAKIAKPAIESAVCTIDTRGETMAESNLPPCPVEVTIRILCNKWRFLIVRDLLQGPMHFNEMMKRLEPISHKILTANLKELEERGVVVRTVVVTTPMRTSYELTERGMRLEPVLQAMHSWGDYYRDTLDAG